MSYILGACSVVRIRPVKQPTNFTFNYVCELQFGDCQQRAKVLSVEKVLAFVVDGSLHLPAGF